MGIVTKPETLIGDAIEDQATQPTAIKESEIEPVIGEILGNFEFDEKDELGEIVTNFIAGQSESLNFEPSVEDLSELIGDLCGFYNNRVNGSTLQCLNAIRSIFLVQQSPLSSIRLTVKSFGDTHEATMLQVEDSIKARHAAMEVLGILRTKIVDVKES